VPAKWLCHYGYVNRFYLLTYLLTYFQHLVQTNYTQNIQHAINRTTYITSMINKMGLIYECTCMPRIDTAEYKFGNNRWHRRRVQAILVTENTVTNEKAATQLGMETRQSIQTLPTAISLFVWSADTHGQLYCTRRRKTKCLHQSAVARHKYSPANHEAHRSGGYRMAKFHRAILNTRLRTHLPRWLVLDRLYTISHLPDSKHRVKKV